MKIAIAGNIASGKSTVQNFLQQMGFKVLDTDKCGHDALKLPQVKQAFAELDIFQEDEISRKKLGKLVFNNPEIKQKLENLVHPIIKDNILDFFEQNKTDSLIFVGIPLIFETHMEYLFDKIIFIYTKDEIRLKRLMARNKYDENYAKLRLESQQPQDEKIHHCDFVIYNNGSQEELQTSLNALIKQLV